jgi:hypothetical protein
MLLILLGNMRLQPVSRRRGLLDLGILLAILPTPEAWPAPQPTDFAAILVKRLTPSSPS